MTTKTLIKTLLGVSQIHIDGVRTEKTKHDETMLVIEAHSYKMIIHKCPEHGVVTEVVPWALPLRNTCAYPGRQ